MKKSEIHLIQEMLIGEMKRLDDNDFMLENAKSEVLRSNALTNSAMAYIKSINLQLRIRETAEKANVSSAKLSEELGIR